jgi:hypothetical protein
MLAYLSSLHNMAKSNASTIVLTQKKKKKFQPVLLVIASAVLSPSHQKGSPMLWCHLFLLPQCWLNRPSGISGTLHSS